MIEHLRDVVEVPADEPLTFEAFFEQTRRRLFGAFCLITGNRQEAEEIVQDAFLKVWERWDHVAAMDDPTGYLFATAMNLFRNRARRASLALRKAVSPELRADDLATVEDRMELIAVLRSLPARQRAALVLTEYLGYSSEEAAGALRIRASTVRALSTRGRRAARESSGGAR
jgi:RNA polymerase sigma factor (sigma-70 family)